MANVKPVALCSYCKAELPQPIPSECPACKRALSAPDNPYFASPEYLSYQYDRLADDWNEDVRGPDAKPLSPAERGKWKEIQKSFVQFLRECPLEDKVCALRDALFVMKNLLHAPVPADVMRQLTPIAKQIGELGKTIETYYRIGGEPYDTEIGRVQAITGHGGFGEEEPDGGRGVGSGGTAL